MDRYAVFGNPIGHSKSPFIHTLFARQTQQSLTYERIEAPLDGFETAIARFFANQGKGCNVTVPFKEDAYRLAQQLSPRAKLAGAVNTLKLTDDGILLGDNTDGAGLVQDLKFHGERFSSIGPISATNFDELQGPFDLIINSTSASLSGEIPAIPAQLIHHDVVVYDMMYGLGDTPFNAWARKLGAHKVIDGLGMLVAQAAESFAVWRGIRPGTKQVITELRKNLGML
jgi:shikimate dehydrogenase